MSCPSCGSSLEQNQMDQRVPMNEEDRIEEILKQIVSTYGITIFDNQQRVRAFLMDLAPQLERERKLILSAIQEGVVSELLQRSNTSEEEKKLCLQRCEKQLVHNIWVTESAAHFAVTCIAYALGFDCFEVTLPNTQGTKAVAELRVLNKGVEFHDEQAFVSLMNSFDVLGYKVCAANTNLKALVMNDHIKIIMNKAFLNCIALRSITLPSNLEQLGYCVFEGCYSLQHIELSNNSNYTVTKGFLIDKREKKLLRATNEEQPSREIPMGIEIIDTKAIEYNNVKHLIFPKTVETLRVNAIDHCLQLEKIEVHFDNPHLSSRGGVLFNKTQTEMLMYPAGKKDNSYILEDRVESIADGAFSMVEHLTSITFTNQLVSIGRKAFQYCINLESLLFPGSVEVIQERAFQFCKSLKNVMLSRNIQELGDYAFYECSEIKTISVPRNVTRIGHMAFANCTKLEHVILQDRVSFIGDGAFLGCSPTLEITISHNEYVVTYCKSHGIAYQLL